MERRPLLAAGGSEHVAAALVNSGARFIIVGGAALRWHHPERAIGGNDLDVLVEATLENATRVIAALGTLRLTPQGDLAAEKLAQTHKGVHAPLKPLYWADIITRPDLEFEDLWAQSHEAAIGWVPIRVASRRTLRTLLLTSREEKHVHDLAFLADLA